MILNKIKINDTATVTPGVVYDISKATGQSYETLSDALSGNNVPSEIREGGMSVRFIQPTDNKYVQYRLMSTSFSTNKADWQSVMSAADKKLLEYYDGSRNNYLEVYSSGFSYYAVKVEIGNMYSGSLDDL